MVNQRRRGSHLTFLGITIACGVIFGLQWIISKNGNQQTASPSPDVVEEDASIITSFHEKLRGLKFIMDTPDGKHHPTMGELNCSEWEESVGGHQQTRDYGPDVPLPCRGPFSQGDPDDGGFGIGDDGPTTENLVKVDLYIGLRPNFPSIEPFVTSTLTAALNTTIPKMNFYMNNIPNRRLVVKHNNMRSRNWLRRLLGDVDVLYDIYHVVTETTLFRKGKLLWIWRYTIHYAIFFHQENPFEENAKPAGLDTAESIAATIGDNLALITSDLSAGLQMLVGDDLVSLVSNQVPDDDDDKYTAFPTRAPVTAPPTPEPTVAPTTEGSRATTGREPNQDEDDDLVVQGDSVGTYPNPLDTHDWDWRRYLGLSLFVSTIVGSLLIAQVSAQFNRRRQQREAWGNLASEEGINELLRTGWKVKGSRLEIYDKAKWGYTEDDSMLMGGFEPAVCGIGTEITVTRGSTTETPDETVSSPHHARTVTTNTQAGSTTGGSSLQDI